MNQIQKFKIQHFLKKFGIRIEKTLYYKFDYDRENYSRIVNKSRPIIFDIGANIGQSTLWYLRSFPSARIYAFEPLPKVYKRLVSEVGHIQNVTCLEKAVGKKEGIISIPYIDSDTTQTFQVLKGSLEPKTSDIDIEVITIDNFAAEQNLQTIDILKTDTEGYDLDVLAGATKLLKESRITYILSEATIVEGDIQHTDFYKLKLFLEGFDYKIHSLYDIHHRPTDGRLENFNVLFQINVDA